MAEDSTQGDGERDENQDSRLNEEAKGEGVGILRVQVG
jgi:hypothetical protein